MALTSTTTRPAVKISKVAFAISNIARTMPVAYAQWPYATAKPAYTIVTVTCATHTFRVGQRLGFASVATNTWLNGKEVVVDTVPDNTHVKFRYNGYTYDQDIVAGADTGTVFLIAQVALPDGRSYILGNADITVSMSLEDYENIGPNAFSSNLLVDATV